MTCYILIRKSCKIDINIGRIIFENLGLFMLIGLIEITFFLHIGIKYVPIDSTYIMNYIIEELKKNFPISVPTSTFAVIPTQISKS